jgi:hypothetical protein
MKKQINEKKAAILATDGFEQSEFEKPIEAKFQLNTNKHLK